MIYRYRLHLISSRIIAMASLLSTAAFADTTSSQITEDSHCIDIEDSSQRLSCYDNAARLEQPLTDTVIDSRIKQEAANRDNSFSLIAHRPSYFLPLAYASNPNNQPFESVNPDPSKPIDFDKMEVKFQISFRVPLKQDFLFKNSDLWFGYTQVSLWQLYDSSNSAPFRETNYEPEIIWSFLTNQSIGKIKLTHFNIAFSHQSNGRSEPLSRSWNRIYIDSIWAHKKWAFSFRPWYRLPESEKDDDNPDIDNYMGHFDFRAGYKEDDHQLSTLIRSSFDEDNPKHYYEIGYSFSINRKFRGYAQFLSGYGETLIDYNHRNRRFSIGIMLNDWF